MILKTQRLNLQVQQIEDLQRQFEQQVTQMSEPRLNKCVFCEHDITSCAGEVCDPCAVQANAVIQKFHAALLEHVAWCGFNKHALGSSAFRDALNAYAEWRRKVGSP